METETKLLEPKIPTKISHDAEILEPDNIGTLLLILTNIFYEFLSLFKSKRRNINFLALI